MNIEIRRARQEDVPELVGLARRTILRCYPPFLGDAVVKGFVEGGFVDRYVRENVGNCDVLLEEGEVTGLAVSLGNTIDLMMIDADRHRRGLGSRLLEHVEARLFDGWQELLLESFEGNRQAIAFYRRHGWTEARRFVDEDSGLPKVGFRKARA